MSKRQTTQHVMLSLSEKARQKHSSYKSDISKNNFSQIVKCISQNILKCHTDLRKLQPQTA